jgi:hypothetical protein
MSKSGTLAKIHQTGDRFRVDTRAVEASIAGVMAIPNLNRLFTVIDEVRGGKTTANDEIDQHLKTGLVVFKGILEQIKEANASSNVKNSDFVTKIDRAVEQALAV